MMIKYASVIYDTTRKDNLKKEYHYYFDDDIVRAKEGDIVVVECQRGEELVFSLARITNIFAKSPMAKRPLLYVIPVTEIYNNKTEQENKLLEVLL